MYAGHERKTPLMIHALINNSFIESAWRVVDGSHLMINILAENITGKGGTIRKNARAVKFTTDEKSIRSVVTESGEEIEGRYFISGTHPEQLLTMTSRLKVSGAFSYRISNLDDTIGMFTLYLVFKKNSFPYLNYNFYHITRKTSGSQVITIRQNGLRCMP